MKEILKKVLLFLTLAAIEYGIIIGLIWLISFIFRFEFSLLYSSFVWFAIQVMHFISRYKGN